MGRQDHQESTATDTAAAAASDAAGKFTKYFKIGYGGLVIPVIPPNAKLSEHSKVDPVMRGKVPGAYSASYGTWAGLHDWTTRMFTLDDARKWGRWPDANVGIITGVGQYPLIPVDADVEGQTSSHVIELARKMLGDAPVRRRAGSNRLIMLYRLADGEEPIGKMRVQYKEEGWPADKKPEAVEILGRGQHFVIEGLHPSGSLYGWAPIDIVYIDPKMLTPVTRAQLIAFLDALRAMLLKLRCEFGSSGTSGAQGERKEIGDETLRALDLFELAAALDKIPCADLDYHEWMGVLHAVKAACGGDPGFFTEVVWPWCERYAGNTLEIVERKWESINDATVGADYVYSIARTHGFCGGFDEFADTLPPNPAEDAKAQIRQERSELPEVRIEPGNAPATIDAAEQALIAKGDIYKRGTTIVEPVRVEITVADQGHVSGVQLVQVTPARMVELMTRAARFEEFKYKHWRPTNFPREYAQMYLERVGEWQLPPLAGVITAPTLRADGSILDTAGYDQETGLLYDPRGEEIPHVPEEPTRDEALTALRVLETELLADFPFESEAHKAVALSAILTACIRRSLPTAPLHAFSAPVAGSGKSLLVDMIASISEGRRAAVIAPGRSEEELEKRLGAALIAAYTIIAIDNVEQPLGGEFLCSVLTQQSGRVRVLGHSTMIELPFNSLITATGNNLRFRGDMGRRVVLCRLDPKVERPERRTFARHPLEVIRAARSRYVAAALTILRAFHVAGRPRQAEALGSFEVWSDWVRGALLWLGREDPCTTAEQVRDDDPELAALRGLISAWAACFGQRIVTSKQLLEGEPPQGGPFDKSTLAEEGAGAAALRDALGAILLDRNPSNSGGHSQRLGQYLSSVAGRVVDGHRVVKLKQTRDGVQQWRLAQMDAKAAA